MFIVPTKRMEIMTGIQVRPFWWMNFDLRKMMKKKAFLAKPKHQNCVPQRKEHVLVSHHKKNRDYLENPVHPIWWMNFDFMENEELKSFSCKAKALKSRILMRTICLLCKMTIRMEIITRIHVCPIWWTNFESKEKGEKKSFSCKTKASKSVSSWEKCDYNAILEKKLEISTRI